MNLFSALYGAYCRFVENMQKQRVQRLQKKRELQRRARPGLEILPDRIVPANLPATDTWVGSFSSDWNTAGNWKSLDANGQIIPGGAVPVATTDVTIQTLAAGCVAPVIANSGARGAVCGSITDQSGTSLTINAGFSLDVTGQGQKTSLWGDSKNAPALNVNGNFQVDKLGADFNNYLEWRNGNITGTGSVYIANGAAIYVE